MSSFSLFGWGFIYLSVCFIYLPMIFLFLIHLYTNLLYYICFKHFPYSPLYPSVLIFVCSNSAFICFIIYYHILIYIIFVVSILTFVLLTLDFFFFPTFGDLFSVMVIYDLCHITLSQIPHMGIFTFSLPYIHNCHVVYVTPFTT